MRRAGCQTGWFALECVFFESQTQHLSKMIIFCFAIGIRCIHAIVYRMVVISKGVHQIHNSNSLNYAVRVSTVLAFYHLNFLGITFVLNAVIDDQIGSVAVID